MYTSIEISMNLIILSSQVYPYPNPNPILLGMFSVNVPIIEANAFFVNFNILSGEIIILL